MIAAEHSALLRGIAGHAAVSPDKVALVSGTRRVSYGQLSAKILAAASFLQTIGLKPGDRIVVSAQKELEFVYVYLAAHLCGIVNVVVDPTSPRERLDYILDIIRPAALIGNHLDIDGYRCIAFDDVNFEDGAVEGITPAHLQSSDVADVMFTTGTTGAPKGVCLSHANIAGSANNTNGFIGTGADDIEALALPLSHSFGLGRMRCTLMAGATLVLVGNFANLKSFFNALEAEHVTGFGMVPAVWQYIKRLSGRRIAKFAGQVRYIEMGSAPLPVEDKRLLMELFSDTRLCMHYGLTEASRAMFAEFHASADNLESVGRPSSPEVEVCIMDDQGRRLPAGMDGEVCVRGNMVCRSYFLPQDNDGAFWGDWFRTGDWGHCDNEGNYYLTGRKKELINVGGEKVSPVTIETAIISLGVADCACVAIPDPNGILGEVPKAYVQSVGTSLTIDEIKGRLADLLPPHEIPVQWEWIERIPRTASGKIQRLKLKQ